MVCITCAGEEGGRRGEAVVIRGGEGRRWRREERSDGLHHLLRKAGVERSSRELTGDYGRSCEITGAHFKLKAFARIH